MTSGGTEFIFLTPIDKLINGTLTITKIEIIVRQNGNYLVGSGSTWADVTQSLYSYYLQGMTMQAVVKLSSAPTGVQNNGVVALQVKYTASVS